MLTEKETDKTALENDPYSIAWKKKKQRVKNLVVSLGMFLIKFQRQFFSLYQEAVKQSVKFWMKNVTRLLFEKEDLRYY